MTKMPDHASHPYSSATRRANSQSNFNLNLLSISRRNLLYFPFIYVLIYIFCPFLLLTKQPFPSSVSGFQVKDSCIISIDIKQFMNFVRTPSSAVPSQWMFHLIVFAILGLYVAQRSQCKQVPRPFDMGEIAENVKLLRCQCFHAVLFTFRRSIHISSVSSTLHWAVFLCLFLLLRTVRPLTLRSLSTEKYGS